MIEELKLKQGESSGVERTGTQPVQVSGETESETNLNEDRGSAAVRAAYLTYQEGLDRHGQQGSWETTGSNRGPLVDEIEETNHANESGYEWCGMFIGHSYEQAGIREEILRNLVFWSGHRLHLFFTQGKYLGRSAGSWWQGHTTMQIGATTGEKRKEKLDAFAPRPGDVALFRSDYSHVGMVTSYNSETGDLEIIEGNRGNRVQANIYDSDNGEITFIGRFNASDYEPGSKVDEAVSDGPQPHIEHAPAGKNSTT